MHQNSKAYHRWSMLLLLLVALWLGTPERSFSADGPLVVDVVTLKTGRSLRGALLARQSEGALTMVVSRDWLQGANPTEFTKQADEETKQQRSAWGETKDRIEKELAAPPEAPRFVHFLKQELARLEQALAAEKPETSPFFLIEVPGNQVKKISPASDDHKRLLLFAWNEELPHVETTSARKLQKQLADAGIKLDGPPPDLSNKLPARSQSDAEWQARLAIVKDTLTESLSFQGTGDILVRTRDGQPPDIAALLPKLLGSQVDSLLGSLLNPEFKAPPPSKETDPASLQPAIAIAEKKGQQAFRVTRLQMNTERMTVAVQTQFVVKLADEGWKSIWGCVETADGTLPRPALEARIADDPQVKTLLRSLSGLGDPAGNDTLTRVIRFGAATMTAQQAADGRFFEFRDRYVRRLDGPPLILPVAE